MIELSKPEGELLDTRENREAVSSLTELEKAMQKGTVVEGIATVCDSDLRLHVDLGCAHGILEPEETVFCREGEVRKDIAIVSRVGKPICARILRLERRGGEVIAHLSRRLAQKECLETLMTRLSPGDLIPARVTHMEPFGAFLDVGCGISSLLSVDCISVSRISHPRDRLSCGQRLTVAVKCIDRDLGRIFLTLRELLGTWEENAARFRPGQTVTGVIRSVESYGVFVELTPNLAGLAEVRSQEHAAELRSMIGKSAAVYIKSIVPDRMKIKLVLIDAGVGVPVQKRLETYIDGEQVSHLSHWLYSPVAARRRIETVFDPLT